MVRVPEASSFLRAVAPLVIGLNHCVQRTTVRGSEHIPKEGPAIVVANHTVHADSLLLGEAIYRAGRAPHFVAGSNFFDVPGAGFILRGVEAIKVERGTSGAKGSLDGIRRILDDGGVVLLFPEGGVTHDPLMWPMRAKTGLARLMASHPHVPVIPSAHWGGERLLDAWTYAIDWKNVGSKTQTEIVFGPPLDIKISAEPDYDELASVSEQVMTQIETMLIPLREANPAGLPTAPRLRRWQTRFDGDPLNDEYELRCIVKKSRRRGQRRVRR